MWPAVSWSWRTVRFVRVMGTLWLSVCDVKAVTEWLCQCVDTAGWVSGTASNLQETWTSSLLKQMQEDRQKAAIKVVVSVSSWACFLLLTVVLLFFRRRITWRTLTRMAMWRWCQALTSRRGLLPSQRQRRLLRRSKQLILNSSSYGHTMA